MKMVERKAYAAFGETEFSEMGFQMALLFMIIFVFVCLNVLLGYCKTSYFWLVVLLSCLYSILYTFVANIK